MKKNSFFISIFSLALMCGIMLTSCGSDDGTLSKGDAEDALEDIVLLQDSSQYISFNTGYYEVDRHDYIFLNKLKNAEVITVKFDTKYNDKEVGYWSNKHIKQEKHVFAKVDFTDKGKKYIISNVPSMRLDIKKIHDKLNKEIENDEPEYLKVDKKVMDYFDVDAKTGVNNKPEKETVMQSDNDYADDVPDKYLDEYEKALKKTHKESFDVLLGYGKLDKVYEIYCPEELKKVGKAECKFLIKVEDFTPFGWAVYNIKQGKIFSFKASLKHYEDKGWVVEDYSSCEE